MLQNLTVVLERPLYAGNIGAAARAMKNMGLKRLALVAPVEDPHSQDAIKMAMGSKEILTRAKIFPTMAEALKGFQLVIGTTRRKGRIRKPLFSPREMAEKAVELLATNKVALVFGNEKDGMTNEDLFQCHWITHIPTAPAQPSLNLAQAVMVYCYEIFLAASAREFRAKAAAAAKSSNGNEVLANHQTGERMYQLIDETLLRIGFYAGGSPRNLMRSVRQLLGKANLTDREVRILRGIFGQMQRVLDVGQPNDLP